MSGQTAFDKLVRLAALCRAGEADIRQFEDVEETELNGVEEGEDRKSDEEAADGVEGEGNVAPPDWRVKASLRNKPTQKERKEQDATHVPFRDWCTHCMVGRKRTHHHVTKQKCEDNREERQLRWTTTT